MLGHPPAQIIARYMVEEGLCALAADASDSSWPVYVGREPSNPDNAVTVYDTTPVDDGRVMDGEFQLHYGFMVRVRSKNYSSGWAKIAAIHSNFEGQYENVITIDGTRYLIHSIVRPVGPISLGTESEESRRHLFTLNALTTITQQ